MGRIILCTYFGLFAMYMSVYHIDTQIIYPYKPFNLIKPTNFTSKFLVVCKDKRRGMVSIAFVLEMIAHSLLIISPTFLILVYIFKWYQADYFLGVYRIVIVSILFLIFGLPGIIAIGVHDHTLRKEKGTN